MTILAFWIAVLLIVYGIMQFVCECAAFIMRSLHVIKHGGAASANGSTLVLCFLSITTGVTALALLLGVI